MLDSNRSSLFLSDLFILRAPENPKATHKKKLGAVTATIQFFFVAPIERSYTNRSGLAFGEVSFTADADMAATFFFCDKTAKEICQVAALCRISTYMRERDRRNIFMGCEVRESQKININKFDCNHLSLLV